jgi:phospholipase C
MRALRLAAMLAIGCAGGAGGPADLGALGPVRGQLDGAVPDGWDTPFAQSDDATADTRRAACAFGAGAMPAQSLGASSALADAIPIDHVLLFMLENRSFDHYLSRLPFTGVTDVDVATRDDFNPDPVTRTDIKFFHATELCFEDIPHSWYDMHASWNHGLNDGFVRQANPGGARAMSFYDEFDLPFYYALARSFAISDRYFCAQLGETLPNRLYFYAASSFGMVENGPLDAIHPTIFDLLNQRHISWKVYSTNAPPAVIFLNVYQANLDKFVSIDQFFLDAARDALPSVAWIDPKYGGGSNQSSEHPPADFQVGQRFAYDVVTAVTQSPAWPKAALFITYDESGGLYDHVPPPEACAPDALDPPPADAVLGTFDRYGFRVPLYVVSPWARPGYVSHVVHSHTSILRFLQARFRMPALTSRDANSDAMLDLFDFRAPALLTPPVFTAPSVDAATLARCQMLFPTGGI